MHVFKKNLPNLLTLFRYACVALLLISWHLPAPYALYLPFIITLLACISDFFDGYLARKWQVVSDLGRLLDPNADKLLIAAGFILLVAENETASAVAVSLILARELFVSGLREFMAERQIVVHVSQLAKWKTACQMLTLLAFLGARMLPNTDVLILCNALLWFTTALTLWTGINYLRNSLPHIKN